MMMEPWAPPAELWQGRTVAILAGGPSLTQAAANAVRARGWGSIAISTSVRLAPWAEMLYAADGGWWLAYRDEVAAFAGHKVMCQKWQRIEGVHYAPCRSPLNSGGNSALHAAELAAAAGASRIVLLGVDLRDDALTHWYGQHPASLAMPSRVQFSMARRAWSRSSLGVLGVLPVINANPESAVLCFPRMRLEEIE